MDREVSKKPLLGNRSVEGAGRRPSWCEAGAWFKCLWRMEPPSIQQPRLVTIVCPVFNEEQSVPLFYARLIEALKPVESKFRFEFLFMNNRSTDRTLAVIQGLQARDPRVRYVTLSRNF